MMILVQLSPKTLAPYRTANLGVLCSPYNAYADDIQEWSWAADNNAFSNWDEEKYEKMLVKITGRENCLFVTCPDVVGDSDATLGLFDEWQSALRRRKLPVALVGQDGMKVDEVPWPAIDALFIGGTTEWKLGPEAAVLGREAKRQGKHLHLGRVNSYERVRYAYTLGCDSVDGSQYSWFRDTKLPGALKSLRLASLYEEEIA